MIDLERSSIDSIRCSQFGAIFKPDNFIFGSEGAGNVWAKGHFVEGAQLCENALNVIRREAESESKESISGSYKRMILTVLFVPVQIAIVFKDFK